MDFDLNDFAEFLKAIQIVRPGVPTGGFDDDGNQEIGAAPDPVTVQGNIQPLPLRLRGTVAGAEGSLTVPLYLAYLPFSAPVSNPGFTLVVGGVSYHPKEDAEDIAGQGQIWRILCSAPNARSS